MGLFYLPVGRARPPPPFILDQVASLAGRIRPFWPRDELGFTCFKDA